MLKRKKNIIKYVSYIFASVVVICFLLYQIFIVGNADVKTETALRQTVYKAISADVFFIRDETLIRSNAGGVFMPLIPDGTRAARGDTVAVYFRDRAAAELHLKISDAEKEIAYYESLSQLLSVHTTGIAALDKNIDSAVYGYADALHTGKLKSLGELSLAVRDAVTEKQLATNIKPDFINKLSGLYAEYDRLTETKPVYTGIKADSAGYYISNTDGFENACPYADAISLTCDEIEALLLTQPEKQEGNAGKLIGSFDWYIACVIDTKSMEKLTIDSAKTIVLPASSVSGVTAKVAAINDTKDGKTSVIFKCSEMDGRLASLRNEPAQIRTEEYTGYKVDNRAIRMAEGVKGVYVLRGNVVTFRKINVVFSNDTFSISSAPATGEEPEKDEQNASAYDKKEYLTLYDEIIVEGTDLYDGKLVRG
ncbi:MAG: hypothetical protein FWF08_02305 [Oscillospiraceae bacterium]|nr:hypothetical protein [Oscillospiraceae bacterium]